MFVGRFDEDRNGFRVFAALNESVLFFALFFIQSFAFRAGYVLLKRNELDVAGLFFVYGAMTFSSMILGQLYSTIPDQNEAKRAAKIVFKIIERNSKIDSMSPNGIRLDQVAGNVEFRNVHFEYATRPGVKILNGFSLSVNNGQSNALVGPSGCGMLGY